jgi:hypothetical protein
MGRVPLARELDPPHMRKALETVAAKETRK